MTHDKHRLLHKSVQSSNHTDINDMEYEKLYVWDLYLLLILFIEMVLLRGEGVGYENTLLRG